MRLMRLPLPRRKLNYILAEKEGACTAEIVAHRQGDRGRCSLLPRCRTGESGAWHTVLQLTPSPPKRPAPQLSCPPLGACKAARNFHSLNKECAAATRLAVQAVLPTSPLALALPHHRHTTPFDEVLRVFGAPAFCRAPPARPCRELRQRPHCSCCPCCRLLKHHFSSDPFHAPCARHIDTASLPPPLTRRFLRGCGTRHPRDDHRRHRPCSRLCASDPGAHGPAG